MKKIYFGIFVIISSILSYNFAHGIYTQDSTSLSSISSGGNLFTEVVNDSLTVDIRDVALEEVLEQISAQNDITFLLPPELAEEKIMVKFSNYKIDEGLNKILAPYNRIFIYSEINNPHQPPLTRLKEVRIYPRLYQGGKKDKVALTSVKRPEAPTHSLKNKHWDAKKRYEKKESVKTSTTPFKVKNQEMDVDKVKEMAEMRNADSIKFLSKALKNKDSEVRKEAEKALEKIGEELKEKSKQESQSEDADEDKEDEESNSSEGEGTNLSLSISSENTMNLDLSNDVPVRAIQFTLNGVKASEVLTTSRTEGFFIKFNENTGTFVLVSLSGGKIAPGSGPIAKIPCDNAGSAQLSNVKIQ